MEVSRTLPNSKAEISTATTTNSIAPSLLRIQRHLETHSRTELVAKRLNGMGGYRPASKRVKPNAGAKSPNIASNGGCKTHLSKVQALDTAGLKVGSGGWWKPSTNKQRGENHGLFAIGQFKESLVTLLKTTRELGSCLRMVDIQEISCCMNTQNNRDRHVHNCFDRRVRSRLPVWHYVRGAVMDAILTYYLRFPRHCRLSGWHRYRPDDCTVDG